MGLWGGTESMIIPFSLAYSTAGRWTWATWLSRIRSTGWSLDGLTVSTKKFNHFKKISELIHPESEHQPTLPTGPLSNILSPNLFLANIKHGGRKLPAALQQAITVVNWPFSAELITPTCLFPVIEITLGGRDPHVFSPLSSILYKSSGFSKKSYLL